MDDIIGTEQHEQVVTKLHEILRPFLLRRLKKDVLLTMPPKKEIVVYCGMSSLQVSFERNTTVEKEKNTTVEKEKNTTVEKE